MELELSMIYRFYNGAILEKDILTKAYLKLVRHVNSIFKIRIAYSMIEDFVIKYAWSAVRLNPDSRYTSQYAAKY